MSDMFGGDPFFGAEDLGAVFQVTDLYPEAEVVPQIPEETRFESIQGLENLSVKNIQTLGPVVYLNPSNVNPEKRLEVSLKNNPETMEFLPVYISNLTTLTDRLKDVACMHREEKIRLQGVVGEKQKQILDLEEKIRQLENPTKKRKT